ncbi:MAG: RagB/SusD family nutrient uptake outer membrane protein [Dysgonamonadaceae bacterium]|jgi:hypothetical protein|nr:RagB/SusD family nutrient uptake outer membrane protein [Dysgonamonadaceae bacterium]
MKTYKYLSLLLLGSILFASCDDYLDRPPVDKFTDEEYWQTETQARTFLYSVYSTLFAAYGTSRNPTWMEEVGDDAISSPIQSAYSPDIIPSTDGSWTFTNVRKANYVIESASRLNESEETINHWLGIGHFLRGYFYSSLTFQYGDVPWFDRVPQYSDDKAELDYLYKDRDPRNLVTDNIIEDFQFALANVRLNDGALQINRYVVAALVSRLMLREGTFQKYVSGNNEVAQKCLALAKTASELVLSGPYSPASDYKSLFVSADLAGNPEIIMYRKYIDGILTHFMMNHNFDIEQNGASKSLTESFLRKDGFPIYYDNEYWFAPTAAAFFADRDPRLSYNFRPQYYPFGGNNAPFSYSRSGYSLRKYMDDSRVGEKSSDLTVGYNVTDAPCLRLGEVLVNYAEICYELETITGADVFNQATLDMTINKLRDRVGMPHLEEIGGKPAVGGQTYDDPQRTKWEPNNDVSSMLWEIRRERRVELCYENGLRSADLKRWHKLDYLCNVHNPDYRYGAYVVLTDFPAAVKESVSLAAFIGPDEAANAALTEGYILRNTDVARSLPTAKNYVKPIPVDQIALYRTHGYTLSQTKEWQTEN